MVRKPYIFLGLGIAAAVGYGLYKGLSLKETADNARVGLLSAKIHTITPSLKVFVDLKVDNPAKERVTVKIPSIRLYYKGKLLASTAVSDKTYTIDPVSTGKITGIMIDASYFSLLASAPAIITDYAKQGASLTANFGFDVIAEVNGIPLKVQKL